MYFSNRYLARHPGFIDQFNQQVFGCLPEIGVLQTDERERLQQLYAQLFSAWKQEPRLIDAVIQHNSQHNQLSMQQIHARDQQWQQEQANGSGPLIDSVLNSPAADWLRARQAEHEGLISEILLTDQQGLNVAVSGLTTDYWQGDEAKFAEPFFASTDRPYMSQLAYDQSTQRYQVHISTSVRDPQTGAIIGVLIIGLDTNERCTWKTSTEATDFEIPALPANGGPAVRLLSCSPAALDNAHARVGLKTEAANRVQASRLDGEPVPGLQFPDLTPGEHRLEVRLFFRGARRRWRRQRQLHSHGRARCILAVEYADFAAGQHYQFHATRRGWGLLAGCWTPAAISWQPHARCAAARAF
ncbi:PDC sensor domain-containing protein [Halopseudomonas pachastrellae]|nr:PDC sensor domain-containing protein [Halopseudomonas pachastrellae]